MTADGESGDGERPLVLAPLPSAGAAGGSGANGANGANGASADPQRRRDDHGARAAHAQLAAAARARGDPAAASADTATDAERTGAYAGLATRTIAFVLDAALIDLVALTVGVAAALALSVFHLSSDVKAVVVVALGAAYVLWAVGYFVAFWSTTGQTPGARVMHIRVMDRRGAPALKPRRALVRVAGLALAAIPLFAGFLMMLWDGRRRCLQDRLARTVVVHAVPQVRIVRRDRQS